MNVLIILLHVLSLHFASGVRAVCGTSAKCIVLTECPTLLTMLKTGSVENIRRVRESICGYEMKQLPKVCCQHGGMKPEITQPSAPSHRPDTPPQHGILLPSLAPDPPAVPPPPVAPTPSAVPPSPPAPPPLPVHLGNSLLPKVCGKMMIDTKIVGGTVVPIGSYPWMVALGYIDMKNPNGVQFLCAGSLISSRYVLTAAHCLDSGSLEGKLLSVVHLGDWDISTMVDCQVINGSKKCSPPHLEAGIEEKVIHPSYNSRAESSDDVALIRMNISVPFETTKANIRPLCLPPKGLNPRTASQGRLPVAAGWGFTEHGNQSNILLRVDIPFADDELCRDIYGERFLEDKQLCVGGSSTKDTCSGDSGAPLFIRGPRGPSYLQIGIVAYGSLPCAISQVPGVYTSVSEYSDWIKENIKP